MADNKGREFLDNDLDDEEDEDTQKDKYLTFHLAQEEYGVELYYVLEVIGMQKITEMPDMPAFIKGLINLRGQVIPVMDVRLRFGMEPREYDERTCVVVVNIQDISIGLVVDEVEEVLNIPKEQVQPPPKISRMEGGRFIQGLGKVGDGVKILLDVNELLFEEELEQVASAG
ncbi:MAG: chemotaxis protein CheW [Thermodesulfobacteriota bacterium]|nr:chemotaxis protein CheW [Thermodesulfobacteriota bacterium]